MGPSAKRTLKDSRAFAALGMSIKRLPIVGFARFQPFIMAVLLAATWGCLTAPGRTAFQSSLEDVSQATGGVDAQSEAELQTGIALSSQGRFQEAIPHFLAAQGRVANEFAADFNLALCYVATSQFQPAIQILNLLAKRGHATADVYNLLAQALLGNGQSQEAFAAFQKGVSFSPKNEKLYLLMADACMDHQNYELGLKAVEVGLQHLPQSARLHYERGVFFSFLDQSDRAGADLQSAAKLAPGSVIAYLATAQKGLLDGNMTEAIQAARQGIRKDPHNYILLAILGEALIRNGVGFWQPEFAEAHAALEGSLAQHPDYWVSQLALGQLDLMANRLDDAISHLKIARQLAPTNASVYSHLAIAYRKRGDLTEARKMLAVLANLNQQEAARYKLAPPDHMGAYIGSRGP